MIPRRLRFKYFCRCVTCGRLRWFGRYRQCRNCAKVYSLPENP